MTAGIATIFTLPERDIFVRLRTGGSLNTESRMFVPDDKLKLICAALASWDTQTVSALFGTEVVRYGFRAGFCAGASSAIGGEDTEESLVAGDEPFGINAGDPVIGAQNASLDALGVDPTLLLLLLIPLLLAAAALARMYYKNYKLAKQLSKERSSFKALAAKPLRRKQQPSEEEEGSFASTTDRSTRSDGGKGLLLPTPPPPQPKDGKEGSRKEIRRVSAFNERDSPPRKPKPATQTALSALVDPPSPVVLGSSRPASWQEKDFRLPFKTPSMQARPKALSPGGRPAAKPSIFFGLHRPAPLHSADSSQALLHVGQGLVPESAWDELGAAPTNYPEYDGAGRAPAPELTVLYASPSGSPNHSPQRKYASALARARRASHTPSEDGDSAVSPFAQPVQPKEGASAVPGGMHSRDEASAQPGALQAKGGASAASPLAPGAVHVQRGATAVSPNAPGIVHPEDDAYAVSPLAQPVQPKDTASSVPGAVHSKGGAAGSSLAPATVQTSLLLGTVGGSEPAQADGEEGMQEEDAFAAKLNKSTVSAWPKPSGESAHAERVHTEPSLDVRIADAPNFSARSSARRENVVDANGQYTAEQMIIIKSLHGAHEKQPTAVDGGEADQLDTADVGFGLGSTLVSLTAAIGRRLPAFKTTPVGFAGMETSARTSARPAGPSQRNMPFAQRASEVEPRSVAAARKAAMAAASPAPPRASAAAEQLSAAAARKAAMAPPSPKAAAASTGDGWNLSGRFNWNDAALFQNIIPAAKPAPVKGQRTYMLDGGSNETKRFVSSSYPWKGFDVTDQKQTSRGGTLLEPTAAAASKLERAGSPSNPNSYRQGSNRAIFAENKKVVRTGNIFDDNEEADERSTEQRSTEERRDQ